MEATLHFDRIKWTVQAAFGRWHSGEHDDVVLIEQQILGDLAADVSRCDGCSMWPWRPHMPGCVIEAASLDASTTTTAERSSLDVGSHVGDAAAEEKP